MQRGRLPLDTVSLLLHRFGMNCCRSALVLALTEQALLFQMLYETGTACVHL